MDELVETDLGGQSTLYIDPGDEYVMRDGSSRPYQSVPGDLRAPHEPLVPYIDLVSGLALERPIMLGEASGLEMVFRGAVLFPGPTAIMGRLVVPPVFVFDVPSMNPFHPRSIFLGGYGPNELSNSGFIPGHEVFNPNTSEFLASACVRPRDVRSPSILFFSAPQVIPADGCYFFQHILRKKKHGRPIVKHSIGSVLARKPLACKHW